MRRFALVLGLLASSLCQAEVQFAVHWDKELYEGPFRGRVVVYLSSDGGEPRFGPDWFKPNPMYSATFSGVTPGQPMVLNDANTTGFPGRLSALPAGTYTVQAVIDRNLGGRAIGDSPGNLYSDPVQVAVSSEAKPQIVNLACSHLVTEQAFKETHWVRQAVMESKLLGDWYGRPVEMRAAVVLPDEWFKEPTRQFPVIYEIPGFGGTHYMLSGLATPYGTDRDGTPFIYVVLDPDCPTGHCVFADSANNGPWGKALTQEFIPFIEGQYRALAQPYARFVTGHSSGGWSSLWLQVAFPAFFGGVWSTSPDPVDFRDFQRINLYAPHQNMFHDDAGKPRPIARFGPDPILFYRPFSDMERPIRGEQLGSFEAVFSPKGVDGNPMKLWDRNNGAVDPTVAQAWRKYDIDLILRANWQTLAPNLAGKLHVYTGDMDTFYLEGAVKLLRSDLRRLGSDAAIEILPGDHSSVMTPALLSRIDREMAAQFKRGEANALGPDRDNPGIYLRRGHPGQGHR
jgi:S-formylglutathione hydrolase FrmB